MDTDTPYSCWTQVGAIIGVAIAVRLARTEPNDLIIESVARLIKGAGLTFSPPHTHVPESNCERAQ